MPRTEWAARSRKLVNGDFAQAFLGNTREGTAAICITAFSSLVARPIVATRIIYTELADGGAFLCEEDKKFLSHIVDWKKKLKVTRRQRSGHPVQQLCRRPSQLLQPDRSSIRRKAGIRR